MRNYHLLKKDSVRWGYIIIIIIIIIIITIAMIQSSATMFVPVAAMWHTNHNFASRNTRYAWILSGTVAWLRQQILTK